MVDKIINLKLSKIAEYLLLPLMLINLTVAENKWRIFGFRPDQFIYAVTIGLAFYMGYRSKYRDLVGMVMALAIVMRLLSVFGGEALFQKVSFALLAIIFALSGAEIYGRNPSLLHRQLVAYFSLCIPIMLLQILGVSSFLMGWNIGYLHDPSILNASEIGSFKEVPLFPTLFVGIDDLEFSIGQVRPVGLMYGSNPLSIFVSIVIAINLSIARSKHITLSDIIVTTIIVLAMSKLVFGVTIIVYTFFLVFGPPQKRRLVMKLIFLLAIGFYLYYILFPGLFIKVFSVSSIMVSIMLRLTDLWKALGIEMFLDRLIDLSYIYRPSVNYEIQKNYSSVAMLLRSRYMIFWLSIMASGLLIYLYRIWMMGYRTAMVYSVTLLTCILTQFAVPFHKATSFQLIIGFALFPLFKKMWFMKSNSHMYI